MISKKPGNRKGGFTFVELMLAVAILASGLLFVYKAFFISTDYINHACYRLQAIQLMNNRIAKLERDFRSQKNLSLEVYPLRRDIIINGRPMIFNYETQMQSSVNSSHLREIGVSISWHERMRDFKMSRFAYLSDI